MLGATGSIGRQALDIYLNLTNYVGNWKRLGFTDEDVRRPPSDRLVDALVAYGTPDDIAKRLTQHIQAGANHVPIQILGNQDRLIPTLTALAGPLNLAA